MNRYIPIILFILLLFIVKPNFIFKPNGKIREYGVGYDCEKHKRTLFNIHFLIILFAVIYY